MFETLKTALTLVGALTGAAIAFLAVLAPLTKSNIDNKLLDALRFVEDKLLGLVLPGVLKSSDLVAEPPKDEPKVN